MTLTAFLILLIIMIFDAAVALFVLRYVQTAHWKHMASYRPLLIAFSISTTVVFPLFTVPLVLQSVIMRAHQSSCTLSCLEYATRFQDR